MPPASGAPRKDQYTVGWICALQEEVAAAKAMLDEEYEYTMHQEHGDPNSYSFGRIKHHHVVIAGLPSGDYGASPATMVASQMLRSYPYIVVKLMVGIGGGVPSSDIDIRLGDVVVSQPHGTFGGVVQYDRGKNHGHFERTGQLDRPPPLLLNALKSMQANQEMQEFNVRRYIHENLRNNPSMLERYDRPPKEDELYQADYNHLESDRDCTHCDRRKLVIRQDRKSATEVKFHYGTIASGNQVMKHGSARDKISRDLRGILCFEMEAAGLMNNFSCLVIRGVCDYADSHKNKVWQRYAALTAAAYAKKLLSIIPKSGRTIEMQSGLPFSGSSARLAEPSPPQGTPQFRQLTSSPRQPIEQGSLSSEQNPLSFPEPFNHNQPSPYSPGTTTSSSPISSIQSASEYSQSPPSFTSPLAGYSQQGTAKGFPYPDSVLGNLPKESTHPSHRIPYLQANALGHSEPNLTRNRGFPGSPGDVPRETMNPQFGLHQGYLQSPGMVYPQPQRPGNSGVPSQPNRGHSDPAIPLRTLPPIHRKQLQNRSLGIPAQPSQSRGLSATEAGSSRMASSFDTSQPVQSRAPNPDPRAVKPSEKADTKVSRAQPLERNMIPSHRDAPRSTQSNNERSNLGQTLQPSVQDNARQGHSGGAQASKAVAPSLEGKGHMKDAQAPNAWAQSQTHHGQSPAVIPSTALHHEQSAGSKPNPCPKRKEHPKETLHEGAHNASAPINNHVAHSLNKHTPTSHDHGPSSPGPTNNDISNKAQNDDDNDDTESDIASKPSHDTDNRIGRKAQSQLETYNVDLDKDVSSSTTYPLETLGEPANQQQQAWPGRLNPYDGQSLPSYDQQGATPDKDLSGEVGLGHQFGGEADEYYDSRASMGENEYPASQAMGADFRSHSTTRDTGTYVRREPAHDNINPHVKSVDDPSRVSAPTEMRQNVEEPPFTRTQQLPNTRYERPYPPEHEESAQTSCEQPYPTQLRESHDTAYGQPGPARDKIADHVQYSEIHRPGYEKPHLFQHHKPQHHGHEKAYRPGLEETYPAGYEEPRRSLHVEPDDPRHEDIHHYPGRGHHQPSDVENVRNERDLGYQDSYRATTGDDYYTNGSNHTGRGQSIEEPDDNRYHGEIEHERDLKGRDSSSDGKSYGSHDSGPDPGALPRSVGDFQYEEVVDNGCGWCCGTGNKDDDDEECCGWLCCSGENKDHDDDDGCCGGSWCCGGDDDKSHDGEANGCCTIM